MMLLSKKIDIFHEIKFEYQQKEYTMNTNLDVCVGDICTVRLSNKIIDVIVTEANRLFGEVIIDPRILNIKFECDSNNFDFTTNEYNHIYKVKLMNVGQNGNIKYFVSDTLFNSKTIVFSKSNFGIIEEEVFIENCFVEDCILKAYQVILDKVEIIYNAGIVPRFLLNELSKKFNICTEKISENQKYNDKMFSKLMIDDGYQFTNHTSFNAQYLTNNARLGDLKCQTIIRDLSERLEHEDETDYWNKIIIEKI